MILAFLSSFRVWMAIGGVVFTAVLMHTEADSEIFQTKWNFRLK